MAVRGGLASRPEAVRRGVGSGRRFDAVSGLWACAALAAVANVALTVVAWPDLAAADAYWLPVESVATIVYATLGAMIVRRAGNRIGWLLLVVGNLFAVVRVTSSYAVVGIDTHPGLFPAARLVGAISEWAFVPVFACVAYVLLLFPTGALPTARWRPVVATTAAITTLLLAGFIVTPRMVALPAPGGVSLVFPNPLAIESLGQSLAFVGLNRGLSVFNALLLGVAIVALLVRYRSGDPELRQQIKWVTFAAAAGVASQVVASLGQAACGCDHSAVTVVAYLAQAAIALVGVPVAITIAILKYGLYQIDVVINRALVYGSLTVVLVGGYLGSVLLLQPLLRPVTTQSDLAVAGSTLAVAALFRPARLRIQHAVDRRFYRSRYDAGRTIDDLAVRLRRELDLEAVGLDLKAVVRETLQPVDVTLWLPPSAAAAGDLKPQETVRRSRDQLA